MRRFTPSMVISVVALVAALGGTAWASHYIITSTKQIKPSVRHALKGTRGPRGFTGAQGAQGLAGAPGSPGVLGVIAVDGAQRSYPPGDFGAPPNAQCPAGTTVIGTGFNGPFNQVGGFVKKYGTFVGGFFENDSSITVQGNVQAICAQLPAGVPATRQAAQSQRFADDLQAAIAAVEQRRGG
jgi:hypothetical protein